MNDYYIDLTRKDLFENLVLKFVNNNNRSVLINHNTLIVKVFFDIPKNKACSIFDAAYRLLVIEDLVTF